MLASAHVRLAWPSRDLSAAERFWTAGLGLPVLWRNYSPEAGEHALLMVGWPEAHWHLELTHTPGVGPSPTPDDLLVIYLDMPVPDNVVDRLQAAGGHRVRAHNPYWDDWGVTIADPDGYRLVLCERGWSNEPQT